jgi:hypothetical protein
MGDARSQIVFGAQSNTREVNRSANWLSEFALIVLVFLVDLCRTVHVPLDAGEISGTMNSSRSRASISGPNLMIGLPPNYFPVADLISRHVVLFLDVFASECPVV